MASLNEMVMAAETKQAGRVAADPLQSGAAAFAGGLEKGFDKDRQLLQAIKVLEIQAKMEDIKHQTFSDKFTRDVMRQQYPGMFPEEDYRKADFDEIGSKGVPASAKVATNLGIVKDIVDDADRISQSRKLEIKPTTRGYGVVPKKVEKIKEPTVTESIKLEDKMGEIEKKLEAWKIDPRRARGTERTRLEARLKRIKERLGVPTKTVVTETFNKSTDKPTNIPQEVWDKATEDQRQDFLNKLKGR